MVRKQTVTPGSSKPNSPVLQYLPVTLFRWSPTAIRSSQCRDPTASFQSSRLQKN